MALAGKDMNYAIRINHILVSLLGMGLFACGEESSNEAVPMRKAFEGSPTTMNIEVLTIPGCQVTPPTVDLVKETANEMGTSYEVSIVTVENHKQANDHKFIGSPTVRINGVDIDPDADLQKQYGVT